MYTDPQIVDAGLPSSRAYVKVLISGTRHRFYNGKPFGLHCFPNRSHSTSERLRLLKKLQYELKKKLEKGWRPNQKSETESLGNSSVSNCIAIVLNDLKKEDISDRYLADIIRISKELLQYLNEHGLGNLSIKKVDHTLIGPFLEVYQTSAGYYMMKRSTLAGLFTRFVRKGMVLTNAVWKTNRKKTVTQVNEVYTKPQLRNLLTYLQEKHSNLYLCALIMYGCFLRPHREIRLLKRKHFNHDYTQLTLGGDENKGKRIRIVRIPPYVKQELLKRSIDELDSNHHVITGTSDTFNPDYFKKAWSRLKPGMIKSGLIEEGQTLYSFRHTGAVQLYLKTKDPYKVQQAMGHTSLMVTLTYLRSLGISTSIAEDLPEL